MSPAESPRHPPDDGPVQPPIQCEACASALHADGSVSFLLLDQFKAPIVGCDDHLEQFTTVCGYTTDGTVELLDHRPAGGVPCPSCHLASYSSGQPVVPVQDGAVAVLACPKHQSAILSRFHQGLDTQQQLTGSLDLP